VQNQLKKNIPKHPRVTSSTPASQSTKGQGVMQDLREQIAKESASLDMIYKQKQLQI